MKLPVVNPNLRYSRPSPISEIGRRAQEEAQKYNGKSKGGFINFSRGEVAFSTPDYITEAHNAALNDRLTKYPGRGGEKYLKKTILEEDLERQGINGLDYSDILITQGTQQGLDILFNLFANNGYGVVSEDPMWSSIFCSLVPCNGYSLTSVPFTRRDGKFHTDYGRLEEALEPEKERIFYLNNPNNPTGKNYSGEGMEVINDMAIRNNVVIFSDEVYKDLVFDGKEHVSMMEFQGDHIFGLRSFSKIFAATGYRCGYVVCRNDDLMNQLTNAQHKQTNGVPPFIQYSFNEALSNNLEREKWKKDSLEIYQKRKDSLYSGLVGILGKDKVFEPDAGLYVSADFSDVIPKGTKNVREYLLNMFFHNGLAVIPGEDFSPSHDFDDFVRFCFASVDSGTINDGIDRMQSFLK